MANIIYMTLRVTGKDSYLTAVQHMTPLVINTKKDMKMKS